MYASSLWINDYLDRPASAEEQAELLTRAGFPLEGQESVAIDGGTDTRLDVELTSNRGDCLCHVGLAREMAAVSGRGVKPPRPAVRATGPQASAIASVTNLETAACPLYTARIIRGVKVGPSPRWLASRLQAIGQIPRNSIVDASNFVLFELGQPTHVFDLEKLTGPQIIVRRAHRGEPFLPIGEGAADVKLSESDLVIADAARAVAIAGVKGGALTAVSGATTDILIEAATFDPVQVRAASRRLGIASDSSYRFERQVNARQVDHAAERLVELILNLCGGVLCEGVLRGGAPIPPRLTVAMRCERCRRILGRPLTDAAMLPPLEALGFQPRLREGGVIECTVPDHRSDITREIDLIEEVCRITGLDAIDMAETIRVRVPPVQGAVMARRAVLDSLAGMGLVETITHSLVSEPAGAAFMPPDLQPLCVEDERARAAPMLRPSMIPSLLGVLAHNRNGGVMDTGLFEIGSVFAMRGGQNLETVNLAVVLPCRSGGDGVRQLRGIVDRVAQVVLGRSAVIEVLPEAGIPWFTDPGVGGIARLDGRMLGTFGVLSPRVLKLFDLAGPVAAAEIGLPQWFDRYPPDSSAAALPGYPAIDRDVSAIVDDRLPWVEVKSAVADLQLQHLEAIEFVTTFRATSIGEGRKSITLRTRFRAGDRTLTHDEVDPQMQSLMAALRSRFGAEIRSSP
jgi:phenylalanyl-tRNA synthetase beta chain